MYVQIYKYHKDTQDTPMHIYIYTKREREKQKERERESQCEREIGKYNDTHTIKNIRVYVSRERDRERCIYVQVTGDRQHVPMGTYIHTYISYMQKKRAGFCFKIYVYTRFGTLT